MKKTKNFNKFKLKKITKYAVSFVCMLMLCLQVNVKSFAAVTFSDVRTTSWYYNDLNVLVSKGIVKGYTDGTFKPTAILQKNQFIALVVRALTGNDYEGNKGDWATGILAKARELRLIETDNVVKSDTFYATVISKAEVAAITTNALRYLGETYPGDYEKYAELLRDKVSFNSSIKESIYKAYYKGIIVGYPDGNYSPLNNLTRSEAVSIVNRIIDKSVRKSIGILNQTDINNMLNNYPKQMSSTWKFTTDFDAANSKAAITRTTELKDKAISYVEDIEYGPYKTIYRNSEDAYIAKFASVCGTAHAYYNGALQTYANYAALKKMEKDSIPAICQATFTTDDSLIYLTNIGTIKVRGMLRMIYESSNDKTINTSKTYEKVIDVELIADRYGNIWAKQMIEVS